MKTIFDENNSYTVEITESEMLLLKRVSGRLSYSQLESMGLSDDEVDEFYRCFFYFFDNHIPT